MSDELTLGQLLDLANFERGGMTKESDVDYISYLWSLLQDCDPSFADDLQRDYKIYTEEIKT